MDISRDIMEVSFRDFGYFYMKDKYEINKRLEEGESEINLSI